MIAECALSIYLGVIALPDGTFLLKARAALSPPTVVEPMLNRDPSTVRTAAEIARLRLRRIHCEDEL